ncbi:DUF1427 family protein [Burkholderia sp. IMCC1007]|uniref:DUF1427 family protein n=1 Tax=Burkholderia sp. IMCC1007 TaxID=3004104 RepID=UPI0022B4295B|nr:DUF1427 family protein [Burkholderia sp. IMCC1007]
MSYLIFLGAGIAAGLLYYLVRGQSSAPPLITLAGVRGIVVGEHAIPFVHAQSRPRAAQVRAAGAADPTAEATTCSRRK